ncbi:MAG: hypothetical protein VYA55_04545 [Pseudomonadota bacterium]|nr:hypothetical protein [Pseudomonadota bacterium]
MKWETRPRWRNEWYTAVLLLALLVFGLRALDQHRDVRAAVPMCVMEIAPGKDRPC